VASLLSTPTPASSDACASVDPEARGDPQISAAASGRYQIAPGAYGRPYVDASRERTVRTSSCRNGMVDEGMSDERRGDQVDDIAGPAARAADRHGTAARDACRMDVEARRRCAKSPCEHE
jgi:hypothetical protein